MTRENDSSPGFDAAADAAWDELETALAARLREMGPDDLAAVEALTAVELFGATAYVQFCAWETDRGLMIRAEAVSNHYLDATQQLSVLGERELASLGWNRPSHAPEEEPDSGSSNWYVDLLADDAETLAGMSVGALRHAYGIAHPAFLSADGLLPPAPEEQAAPGEGEVTAEDGPVVAVVDSPDALRAVTAEVLTELLGHAPHADADGDFLVPSEHSAFWVLPASDQPALDLTGVAVSDVVDTGLVLLEVNRLNRHDPLVQHVLVDDGTVRAHLRIDCAPFSAAHVRHQVAHFRSALDEAATALTATVQAAAADSKRERRRQAVLTLTELVRGELAGDTPPLVPGMVGEVCGRDEATTAALLRSTQTQLTKVRRVLESGHGTARDHRREEVLRRQRQLLRQALHLVVADAAVA